MKSPDKQAPELEALAARLSESGEYRVLRRLRPQDCYADAGATEQLIGLIVDTETTGPDAAQDKLIELAIIRFHFTRDGRITDVIDRHSWLQDPGEPLTEEIKAITGLTDEALRGQSVDAVKVEEVAKTGVLCIAHNSAFDRRLLERSFPVFVGLRWGCSMSGVNWDLEGVGGRKLEYVLTASGYFHGAHRAINDCEAVLHLLANPLPLSGLPGLLPVLEDARRVTGRLYAADAPYDYKDMLKARGYRWNADGAPGKPRAWYIDLDQGLLVAEQAWLNASVYGGRAGSLPVTLISAKDRYSIRA